MKLRTLTYAILLLVLLGISVSQETQTPPLQVKPDVATKRLITHLNPIYPMEARKNYIQGNVVLRATITPEGEVGRLQVVSGHPLLAQSAVDAVKQWKYQPFLLNGEPVAIETMITVIFRL